MSGTINFGGNPYAPAMQANDAAQQRRTMMAQRLMQGVPAAPQGPAVMPLAAGGDMPAAPAAHNLLTPEAMDALKTAFAAKPGPDFAGAGGNFDANGNAIASSAGGGGWLSSLFGGAG